MPNPDRILAEGDALYTSWIDVLAMTCPEIVLKVGISIGTSTSVIEIYRDNFSSKNITHILYQRRRLLALLSSSMVLNKLLSISITLMVLSIIVKHLSTGQRTRNL